ASGTVHDALAKATATIVVTPYNVTYNGVPHTATGSATGVGTTNLNAQLTLSGTTHTNAGDYPSEAWSFAGGTNYNDASGTVHDALAKATRSEEHTSELQSRSDLVCRLLLEKKKHTEVTRA